MFSISKLYYKNNIINTFAVFVMVVLKNSYEDLKNNIMLIGFFLLLIMSVWLIFSCESCEVKTPLAYNNNVIIILWIVYFRMLYSIFVFNRR